MTPEQMAAEKIRDESAKGDLKSANVVKRKQILQQISPVRELTSDYLGMSSYYYNATQNKIFEIENLSVELRIPTHDVDAHLREINHLPRVCDVNSHFKDINHPPSVDLTM